MILYRRLAMAAGRMLKTAFALSVVMMIPKVAQAQLSVDELEVVLRPDQPGSRTGVMRITNHANKPVQALLEIQDWDRDSTGANRFHELGKVAHSCREQLKVFPMSLRIEAGKTESARVTFEGDAKASCWSVVFIQSNEAPRPSGTQSQITYVIRTGVKVYVEPHGAERAGDIEDVALTTVQASETDTTRVPALAVVFKNAGAAHLKPRGAVELRDENNKIVGKLEIVEFPITPDGVRRVVLALPQMNPGRYVALALLDYGGAEIAAGQYEFTVQ